MAPRRIRNAIFIAAAIVSAGLVAKSTLRAQTNTPPGQKAQQGSQGPYALFAYGGNAAEIPAQFIDNLIFLPLRINESQPSLFLFDPTAESSSIDPNRAMELGISPGQSAGLELPGVTFFVPALPQAPKPDFAARVGKSYDGTLGKDFLESVVVEIDYVRKTVRLYDPGVYQSSGKGVVQHVAFVGTMPVVQAKFGTGHASEASFGVNPALSVSLLIFDHHEGHKPFSAHVRTVPAMDATAEGALLGRLETFQIGPIAVEGAIAEFAHQNPLGKEGAHLAGEIGGGMLRRYIMVFDYAHQQIIFTPSSDIRTDETEDMSGIGVVAKGPGLKTFEVTDVRKGTPGADAGLQKGDVIAGVDQDPAADMTLEEIRDLFRNVGHSYKLTVDRNGKMLTLTIKLRRLLPS